jgi:NTE family protein
VTTLREFLREAPFTCGMSSGFFGFFAHAGMLAALEAEALHPVAFAGSSAGALVGGLAASGRTALAITESLSTLDRDAFADPALGAGLFRGDRFRDRLTTFAQVERLDDCPRPIVVSTFDIAKRRTHLIDRGELAPALYASCAVPLLFQPIRHQGRWLADGGIADRAGLEGVPPGTRLFHHHLASRSPWRRPNSPVLRVVPRANSATLVLEDLPRAGPFALDLGVVAMRLARENTHKALDQVLDGGIVRRSVA